MKNIRWKILSFVIILSMVLAAGCKNKEVNYIDNNNLAINGEVENSVNGFITNLFNADEGALNYVTGSIKANIANGLNNLNEYEIINIRNIEEVSNDDFAVVYSAIEYKEKEDTNVIFYRFKLKKIEDKYLVYQLDEVDPIFDDTYKDDVCVEKAYETIYSYFKIIDNNDLENGAKYLIGKARKNHLLTYEYLSDIDEVRESNLTDFEHEIIFSGHNLSVIESKYKINNIDVTVLFTLYKTQQGWLIYDIVQV